MLSLIGIAFFSGSNPEKDLCNLASIYYLVLVSALAFVVPYPDFTLSALSLIIADA